MSDVRSLLRLYDHARAHRLPAVMASVVGTSGSTYRKQGARMVLCGDGSRVGVVSGGCLEADVVRRAWFLRDAGDAELVRYDTGDGEDATYEFGLGCRGAVEVLLERLDVAVDPPIVEAFRRAIDRRSITTFVTRLRGGRVGERTVATSDDRASDDWITERIEPPPQVLIFGSGVDVPPIVRIANAVGWQAIVIDARLRGEIDGAESIACAAGDWRDRATIDGSTMAVVMTHRMNDDAAYLRDLLACEIGYVGCLGPASRTEALLDLIAIDGVAVTDERRRVMRAPVGLDLGAERPEEIALAIVGEMQAWLGGGDGGPLTGRAGPIHRPRARSATHA